jgi:hypothetical protein
VRVPLQQTLPSVFGRISHCKQVRGVNFRVECHWSHACKSFRRTCVGSNGIIECKFLSENAHRAKSAASSVAYFPKHDLASGEVRATEVGGKNGANNSQWLLRNRDCGCGAMPCRWYTEGERGKRKHECKQRQPLRMLYFTQPPRGTTSSIPRPQTARTATKESGRREIQAHQAGVARKRHPPPAGVLARAHTHTHHTHTCTHTSHTSHPVSKGVQGG